MDWLCNACAHHQWQTFSWPTAAPSCMASRRIARPHQGQLLNYFDRIRFRTYHNTMDNIMQTLFLSLFPWVLLWRCDDDDDDGEAKDKKARSKMDSHTNIFQRLLWLNWQSIREPTMMYWNHQQIPGIYATSHRASPTSSSFSPLLQLLAECPTRSRGWGAEMRSNII